MQYETIAGLNKHVSRLVLGSINFSPETLDESFALLDAAFEGGYNAIDTAHVYMGGGSEKVLGEWITRRGNRDKVAIIDKGCHPKAGVKRVTPEDIAADLQDSLDRLQSDYIDIYLLHRDDPAVPIGPIVEILNEHQKAGRIGIFGGSNWTQQRIIEANRYAADHGLSPFAVSSPNFSLAWQMVEPWTDCTTIGGPDKADERCWYVETQMPVFAYSSLGRGFFSGRLTSGNYAEQRDEMDPVCIRAYCHEPNFQRLKRAEQLAAEMNTSVATIAMAYVMSQPLNIFALVGAQNEAELNGNLAALEFKLTPKQCAWLESGD